MMNPLKPRRRSLVTSRSSLTRRPGIVTAALLLPFFVLTLTPTANPATPAKPRPEKMIEITIETSRSQPTAGTGLGVMAEIKNISDSAIYLKEKQITLTLPPELEGPFGEISGWWGFFPTPYSEPYIPSSHSIALKPGDSYKVFWVKKPERRMSPPPPEPPPKPESTSKPETPSKKDSPSKEKPASAPETPSWFTNVCDLVKSELNFLLFSPGQYKITVVAQYWTDPSFPENGYRTVSQSETILVGTPQSVILFGAGLGGIIAYFIFPSRRRLMTRAGANGGHMATRFFLRAATEVAGVVGSALLSAIVAILLARVSETQFLIRVTVNDFWGAIAIGFVANYAGYKVLDKIVPLPCPGSAEQKPQPSPGPGDGKEQEKKEASAQPPDKGDSSGTTALQDPRT